MLCSCTDTIISENSKKGVHQKLRTTIIVWSAQHKIKIRGEATDRIMIDVKNTPNDKTLTCWFLRNIINTISDLSSSMTPRMLRSTIFNFKHKGSIIRVKKIRKGTVTIVVHILSVKTKKENVYKLLAKETYKKKPLKEVS